MIRNAAGMKNQIGNRGTLHDPDRIITRVIFLILLIGAAYSLRADAGIAESAESIAPLTVGTPLPAFSVHSVDGEPVTIDPAVDDRPMLLISFRGGWCPYCNFHLSELRTIIPELREAGFEVLFLSGDRSDILYENLSRETREDIAGLDYTIYSDAKGNAATTLGIAFYAAERTIRRRLEKDQDIEGSSMLTAGILGVPSVFVIDGEGIVRYVYANPDYKVRLPAADVRQAALDAIAGRETPDS